MTATPSDVPCPPTLILLAMGAESPWSAYTLARLRAEASVIVAESVHGALDALVAAPDALMALPLDLGEVSGPDLLASLAFRHPDLNAILLVTATEAAELEPESLPKTVVGFAPVDLGQGALLLGLLGPNRTRARAQDGRRSLTALRHEFQSFIYSVTHDLKGPLQGIVGISSLLMETEGERLTDNGRHLLERVEAGGAQLADVLDALMRYGRLDRRGVTRERVRLADLVAEACAAGLEEFPDAQFEVAPDLPALRADGEMLGQLIHHLVDNALRYNPYGSPVVKVQWSPRVEGVELVVTDSGPGLPEAVHARVFELFTRHDARDNDRPGMGLALVRKVARLHGGSAHIDPNFGPGLQVRVVLQAPVLPV